MNTIFDYYRSDQYNSWRREALQSTAYQAIGWICQNNGES